MPQAIVITLEKELPGAAAAYAKAGSGKALARESDRLDTAARHRGVAPPTSLLSESQAALAAQLRAEGFDPAKTRLPPEPVVRRRSGCQGRPRTGVACGGEPERCW